MIMPGVSRPTKEDEGEVHEQGVQKWEQIGGKERLQGESVQGKLSLQLRATAIPLDLFCAMMRTFASGHPEIGVPAFL